MMLACCFILGIFTIAASCHLRSQLHRSTLRSTRSHEAGAAMSELLHWFDARTVGILMDVSCGSIIVSGNA
jgi:hypothetical protein